MTKIPTVREMEELLLRDSKTADLIDGRNAKSKSPDTKLTTDYTTSHHSLHHIAFYLSSLFFAGDICVFPCCTNWLIPFLKILILSVAISNPVNLFIFVIRC